MVDYNFNFDNDNDNEIIYLYKEGNSSALQFIYSKYYCKCNFVIKSILYKFYSIPLQQEDFNYMIYSSVKKAVMNFNSKFSISFKKYLLQLIKWDSFNFINKFLTKKHQVLNTAFRLEERDLSYNGYELFNKKVMHSIVLSKLSKLSSDERNIFLYKWNGNSNSDIIKTTNFSYKKIDNAVQRSIKKISRYLKEANNE